MKTTKDKLCLIFINMFMQMIFVFFDIFFSIYIYDMSKNINFVLGYNLFSCVFVTVVEIVVVKLLSSKNFNILYRLSFVLALASIGLVFTINSSMMYMVFIVQAVYCITKIFYYLPHEVATMNYNNKKSIVRFLGGSQMLSLLASILSPFISGFIIDYISYYILFAVIAVLSCICFGLSFGVKQGYVESPKIKYREFFKGVHKIKRVRMTYIAYGLYKFSQNSIVDTLLPVLLFMKVGTNFSVGLYSALAAVASGLALLAYLSVYKIKDIIFIISTIMIVAASVLLTAWTSIIGFFIYYFVLKCGRKVLSHRITQDIYTCTEGTAFWEYKKQNHLTFNLYDHTLKTLAYLIAFLVYNTIPSVTTLSILILCLTLVQIISSALFVKAGKLYDQEMKSIYENNLETGQ